jgi:hypothetical protein
MPSDLIFPALLRHGFDHHPFQYLLVLRYPVPIPVPIFRYTAVWSLAGSPRHRPTRQRPPNGQDGASANALLGLARAVRAYDAHAVGFLFGVIYSERRIFKFRGHGQIRPASTTIIASSGFNERISPDDILARLMDKDQREAADNRTAAERWLGDPPPGRSALAQRMRGAAS